MTNAVVRPYIQAELSDQTKNTVNASRPRVSRFAQFISRTLPCSGRRKQVASRLELFASTRPRSRRCLDKLPSDARWSPVGKGKLPRLRQSRCDAGELSAPGQTRPALL